MISIIIITLNEEKYVGHILSDLTKQSEKPYEIIVVDAHSKDKTVEVVKRFQKKLPIVLLSTQANPSLQRNAGATIASGDTLLFLDADIRLYDYHFLKKIGKLAKEYDIVLPTIKIEDANFSEHCMEKIIAATLFFSRLINLPGARGGCILMAASVFKKIKGFNETLFIAEDIECIRRAAKQGSIYYAPLVVHESNRRYRAVGIMKITMVWAKAGIRSLIGKKTKGYIPIR